MASLKIIYALPFNNYFNQKIHALHYKAVLAFTGGIRGGSREQNFEELG